MAISGGGTITAIGALASPDGQHILAACAATVRIYSALTSALLLELRGHTDDVTAIALDPNSKTKVLLFAFSFQYRSYGQCKLHVLRAELVFEMALPYSGVLCIHRWHSAPLGGLRSQITKDLRSQRANQEPGKFKQGTPWPAFVCLRKLVRAMRNHPHA